MFPAARKINKPNGEVDALEQEVAQALFDLEMNNDELKSVLSPLYIVGAKEVKVKDGKKAIVVFVPPPLLAKFRALHSKLVRELEKKFSGEHVIFLAQRRIMRKPSRKNRAGKQIRPYTRTLTSVHEKMLEDLVFPTEITGRRVRCKVDGSKSYICHLDSAEKANSEYKVDTFRAVYNQLTGKDISFEYPVSK
eukprot:GCRY01000099.1.p1 GENE.GCRY01000099.1~~GCRY01000099.1.p1  ORF type:complete len:193 (-),score=50.06 GCRY01000099.1:97-675(-)